jgi:PPOX class probable F420-dependent enzyme
VKSILDTAKVARLATSDNDQPYLVPVVFVFDGIDIYIPIDTKKKKMSDLPGDLKRVRNILKNPKVAFLIDKYDDNDWSKLYFIMIIGKASILPVEGCREAFEKLSAKYPQYRTTTGYSNMCIRIKPERITVWQNS